MPAKVKSDFFLGDMSKMLTITIQHVHKTAVAGDFIYTVACTPSVSTLRLNTNGLTISDTFDESEDKHD